MNDLTTARALLCREGYTCVLCREGAVHHSSYRGVRPLLELIDMGVDVAGFSAADKVVGKATALLYCLLGVKEVFALVISDAAVQVLQAHGIAVSWETRAAQIRNREGTGRCPMELATESICDPAQALTAIRVKLKELQG